MLAGGTVPFIPGTMDMKATEPGGGPGGGDIGKAAFGWGGVWQGQVYFQVFSRVGVTGRPKNGGRHYEKPRLENKIKRPATNSHSIQFNCGVRKLENKNDRVKKAES